MIALQTDMALPKDVDEVTLQVLSQGVVKFNGDRRALVPWTPSRPTRWLTPRTDKETYR